MQITLDKLITRDVITDKEREKAIALEAQYSRLEEAISKYSPYAVNKQVKAWRAEIQKNPDCADRVTKKIASYPTEAIELRRAAKARRGQFIEKELVPFDEQIKEKFKAALHDVMEEESETHEARCRKYGFEFKDPIVEAIKSELEKLDVFSNSLPTKLFNVSPKFWEVEK